MNLLKEENYLIERKFQVSALSYSEILKNLFCNPFLFREIFLQRTVNNIYLDSFDLASFFDNIDGHSERTKTRIRWYGNDSDKILSPKLEFKIKQGHVRSKKIFTLLPFTFKRGFSRIHLMKMLNNSSLPDPVIEILNHLRLSIYNKYKRRYFLSSDKRFRITLDRDIHYFGLKDSPNYFVSKRTEPSMSIMELKYSPKDDSDASEIIKQFSFRMTKNSKYVSGVSYFINRAL